MTGDILVSTASEEKAEPYVAALLAVGVPEEWILVVTPAEASAARALASAAAALVLCGGADVAPERYGETMLPNANVELVPERDTLEWALLDAARERRLPVWGVCRGIQVLNVYLGGSLWQDLPSQHPTSVNHDVSETPDTLAHTVRVVAPGAPIGERLAREVPRVNSRHHQAIAAVAPGLLVTATAPDGVVEGVEGSDSSWLVGVQWHPENLAAEGDPPSQALFDELARVARARSASRRLTREPALSSS